MNMTYKQLKDNHSKDFDNFPIFFAFNSEQLEKGLAKLRTTKENIVSVGMGGFVAKEHTGDFRKMLDNHNNEMMESLKDDNFLIDALTYELNNHEYCYTHDVVPALEALQLKREEIRPEIIKKAIQNCYREE